MTKIALDHDHETGQLRGALHLGCNSRLGPIENAKFLSDALKYLARWKQEAAKSAT